MKQRASLQTDDEVRHQLRELSGRWGMTMQATLKRLIGETLRWERERERERELLDK
jgi:hypothetical protein